MKKLSVANGTYQKDGVEKTNWVSIGVINTNQNGKEYMLLDPTINLAGFPREAGQKNVMVNIFDDTQQPQQQQYQQPQQQYQQPTPQNNVDDPNRHNIGGSMNRPAQHQQGQQQVQFDQNGDQIPF